MSPYLQPPTPGQVRAALVAHLAKKLGWSGKAVDHLIRPLSNADIARCLSVDAAETRHALQIAMALVLNGAAKTERAA